MRLGGFCGGIGHQLGSGTEVLPWEQSGTFGRDLYWILDGTGCLTWCRILVGTCCGILGDTSNGVGSPTGGDYWLDFD